MHKRIDSDRRLRIRAKDSGEPELYSEQNLSIQAFVDHGRWKFFEKTAYHIETFSNSTTGTILHNFFQNSIIYINY